MQVIGVIGGNAEVWGQSLALQLQTHLAVCVNARVHNQERGRRVLLRLPDALGLIPAFQFFRALGRIDVAASPLPFGRDKFAVLISCCMMVQIKSLHKLITDGFGESLN